MTKPKTPIPDSLTFDAKTFAPAWIAASIAQCNDDVRPVLCSVQIEQFVGGLRVIATDSYMIVRAWAALNDKPEPSLKTKPLRTFTAHDPDKRAAVLMRWAIKSRAELVKVDFGPDLRLSVANESISLLPATIVDDNDYPEWRALWDDHPPSPTDRVGINPHLMFPRLQAIHKLVGGRHDPIIFEIRGDEKKPVRWHVEHVPTVNGLLMPVRITEGT